METAPAGMVGRAVPLAELLHLCAEAGSGRGRAALVVAEAGMGKSTLAEAVASAADGWTVAWGWAAPDAAPYAPWRTALDALLAEHPLSAGYARPARPARPESEAARHALFAAVRGTLAGAAAERGPLLVVLEDLHWADVPSLALLRAVVDGLRGVPLLVLATARDDPTDTASDVAAALRDLPTNVIRVPLFGLGEHDVGAVVAQVTGVPVPAEVVAALHRRTGGNPFFAREVARLMLAQGAPAAGAIPPGVREVLERRLARLSTMCHRVLGVAAVAAQARDMIDPVLVASAAGLPVVDTLASLDTAVAARLLTRESDGLLRFAHALVREVLVAALPAVQRGQLHAAVALALEPHDPEPSALAAHWARAVHPDAAARAGAWSLAAARAAMRQLGFEAAVLEFARALDAPGPDRLAVQIELGQARRLSGDLPGARRTLLDAVGEARSQDRPEDFARAVLGLGGGVAGFEVAVYDDTQEALLGEALDRLPPDDSALRAAVLARLAVIGRGGAEERASLADRAVGMAHRCGDAATEAGALAAYCDAVAGPAHVRARLAAAGRCRVLAESAGDPVGVLLARRLRVVALLELGEFAAADIEIAAYEREAEATGAALYRWLPPIWRAMRAVLRGEREQALRFAQRAAVLGRRAGSENADMMVVSVRIGLHLADGTLAQMLDELRAIAGQPWASPSAGAWFLYEAGDVDGAVRMMRDVTIDGIAVNSEWLPNVWAAGMTAVRLGEAGLPCGAEILRDAYQALCPYAGLWLVDGVGGHLYGVVAHPLGVFAAALGEPAAARSWLEQALTTYRSAGAVTYAADVERALAALPAAPPAGVHDAPAAPTAEVGELARDGRTWRVAFRGRTATLPDSKGLRDLAALLATPGREVHVLDLVDHTGRARAAGAGTGEQLDATARSAYRRRVVELTDELARAEADNDPARTATLRAELDFLTAELAGALGLHGRPRAGADPVERARKAVTMRIGTALRTLDEAHPALGRHLRLAVSTGRFCAYRPEQPVRWTVRWHVSAS